LAGVYRDYSIILLAAMLAPAMLLGVFAGRHITLRLTREHFMKLINIVVLFSGIFLLCRYFSH